MTSDFKFKAHTEINSNISQWIFNAIKLKYFKQDYKYVTEKLKK